MLVWIPAAPFPIQFPASELGKTTGDGPNNWASATHEGETDGVPGCYFLRSLALAVALMWGVNQLIEDTRKSLVKSLFVTLPFK